MNPGEIGSLFTGIGALITALGGMFMVIGRVYANRLKREVTETISGAIANHLEHALDKRDPATYYTLDISFKDGISLIVPMIPLVEVTVAENMHLYVADHTPEETVINLRTTGFAYLKPHKHDHSCETIEVRRGTVTHMESGHIYRPGEIWKIGIGEFHSAAFSDDCHCLVVHRPCLPTAASRPVNLDGLKIKTHN